MTTRCTQNKVNFQEHQLLFKNMFYLLESFFKVRCAELEIITKILLPFSDGGIVKEFL